MVEEKFHNFKKFKNILYFLIIKHSYITFWYFNLNLLYHIREPEMQAHFNKKKDIQLINADKKMTYYSYYPILTKIKTNTGK